MVRLIAGVVALVVVVGLLTARDGVEAQRASLSPFARAKAEALLRDKLPCLGCHRVDGAGGTIGPDLSDVTSRRSAEYIRSMIRDPQATMPGTVMPRVPMPESQLDLVVAYLAGAPGRFATSGPRNAPAASAAAAAPAAVYAKFCSACHGTAGGGDGPNTELLPVRPTAHADSAYMSQRPDAALYDAVFAGGYVMNRSNHMPPFGHTLSSEQIRGLVRHMRVLCRCEGPAWSRDGASDR